MVNIDIIANHKLDDVEEILIKDKKIVPASYEILKQFSQEEISCFCHKHAIYQLPTTELIDFLKTEIEDKDKTIEIGAGNGIIGSTLGIKMTDNMMQSWGIIRAIYHNMKQPTITYGRDVEEIDGNKAVKKYKPETLIGAWITPKSSGNMYGVDEEQFFRDGVKKYIHIGNTHTHGAKTILSKVKYRELKFPWLLSRSMGKDDNVIYVFEG